MKPHNLQPRKLIQLVIILSACLCRHSMADSITVSETWMDNTSGGVYSGTSDTGTFKASLTVPGLSSLTANDWSNLLVTLNPNDNSSLNLGSFSDTMADAPNSGGSVSATSATFYFQLNDTNGNPVNAFEMTFSKSGNTFTIAAQTLNPPSVAFPPWSILTENYWDDTGASSFAINDETICEVVLQDSVSSDQYADIVKPIYITGTDTISYDANSIELNHIRVSGAANYTPPILTSVSPTSTLTTTNDLLTVRVRATDSYGVENVEFYVNGQDYGSGVSGVSNLWSLNFALVPGLNTIQSQATDVNDNNSTTNTLSVTYLDKQTNANAITFSEQWLDSSQSNSTYGLFDVHQDVGTLNAALLVPGLQGLPASTWSNLVLTVSFGDVAFTNSLAAANVLTKSNAVFYVNTDPLTDVYLSVARSGNTLVLAYETGNPTYAYNNPIIADYYLGLNESFQDQEPFALTLQDGNTLNLYANVSQTIFINGSDTVTYDASDNELDNVQIAGAADYSTPTLTAVSPTSAFTTTNDLLTVQVRATDSFGIGNVEFYVNGQDYGSGVAGVSNLWFLNFALQPGTNLIQTRATDVNGVNSPLNSLPVTYVDKQTNANLIAFSEHWQDSSQSNGVYGQFDVSQDVGALNAAWLVPGLQGFSANTWSNLLLSFSFGDVVFSNSLAAANVLTASNAVFYLNPITDPNGNPLNDVYLSVTRSGNTLALAYETGNPTYTNNDPIIADYYLGYGGLVPDVEPFALLLQDGNTLNTYANVSQTVYISATDTVTYDPEGNELDNVKVSGAASFLPPTLTVVSPAAGAQLTNGLVTVQARAVVNDPEDFGAGNVEFFLNNQDFGPGIPGNSNLWTMNFALAPGSNTVRMVATDYYGNNPATNNLPLVYVNRQTNANEITFAERWLDTTTPTPASGPPCCNNQDISLDTGELDAALKVSGLQTMTANTWSNLSLTVSLGNLSVAESLLGADVLTTNKAVFYFTNPNDTSATPDYVEQLTVSRAGNTLLLAASVGNPAYLGPGNFYILAGNYLGVGGPIHDQQPFALTLQDGLTPDVYANVTQPVFIAGNNTVTFDLESNLYNNVQISGAADFVPPTNGITAPLNGQRWSNAVFTVTGKARDNVAVADVFCSVSGGAWSSATTTNNWTNWSAQVTLTPGTNVISAYAADTSGNLSPTNSVKIDYVLSAVLAVQIVGKGAVSPNYNGQLLAIGENYSMTATASNGFAFYFWGGGVPMTTNKTLVFNMASGLSITAKFEDVAKPTNGISFPTASQKWSNSVITVTGKAGDNVGVVGVGVQINNGGWMAAQTLNAYTNWSAPNLPVMFGTNTVQAYAMDAAGNVSPTNTVKFLGVVAPDSLTGYAATLKPSVGNQELTVTWGDGDWSQAGVGNDTNANDYCAGFFDYFQTGPNTAVVSNMDIGMLSDLGNTNFTTLDLTFTSATTANYAWTNESDTASGSGTMTFIQVSNIVPASLAGMTLKVYTNSVLKATTTFTNDVTFGQVEGEVQHSGTYTLTQYSPTVAILELNYTDSSWAGAVGYTELTFTSAAGGDVFHSFYEAGNQANGSDPNLSNVGTFKLAP